MTCHVVDWRTPTSENELATRGPITNFVDQGSKNGGFIV